MSSRSVEDHFALCSPRSLRTGRMNESRCPCRAGSPPRHRRRAPVPSGARSRVPSPVPPALYVTYGSQIRSIRSGGMPHPESLTRESDHRPCPPFRDDDGSRPPDRPPLLARVDGIEHHVRQCARQRVVMARHHRDVVADRDLQRYRRRNGRASGISRQLTEIHRRARTLGQTSELREAPRHLLQPLRTPPQAPRRSPHPGDASRRSRSTANRIGVSGFLSSCAT